MATTNVTVNDETYTQVLNGAGFAYSEDVIEYIFAATQPTGRGMEVDARSQITGTTGQLLWGKAVDTDTAIVFSNPEV